jgi:hypothetical protein
MSRRPHILVDRLIDGGEVVSLTRRPHVNRVRGCIDPRAIGPYVRLERLGKLKIIIKLALEKVNFRVVFEAVI